MARIIHPQCEQCKGRNTSLLHFCHLDELETVSAGKNCSVYKKGESLFHEGNHATGMFCVNSGKIKLYKHASDGREQIVRIAKAGDFVGYRSLLSNSVYPVTAEAMEDATVCVIPKEIFTQLMSTNSQFATGMMQVLCTAIDESNDKMAGIAYKPVRGRLAEALLFLHKFYIDEANPSGIINISRNDLASFVGTVKETTIRTLKEFKDEGLVESTKDGIAILNASGLLKVSELYD